LRSEPAIINQQSAFRVMRAAAHPTTQLFQKKINAEHKKQQQQMM
jgi:hypothetical protein